MYMYAQVKLAIKCNKYRLDAESREIRDLESQGPWAVASERSEDATKGLRLSKSRISRWRVRLTGLDYSEFLIGYTLDN